MTDSPHLAALKKQNQLRRLAKKRIRIVGGKLKITAARRRVINLEAGEAPVRHDNLRPGDMVAGSGIYFGTWEPKDSDGKSLGKVFNMFAAPEDFARGKLFPAALRQLARARLWHGHDGTNYPDDKKIYEALKDGSYNGGWFMPPVEILYGAGEQQHAATDNLCAHKDKGALKGTFRNATGAESRFAHWYCSSTPTALSRDCRVVINFVDGLRGSLNDTSSMIPGIRPVRLEPKP